jgi:hypothetical protein
MNRLSIPCPFLVHALSPHIPNTLCAIDMSPYPKRTPYGAKRRRNAVPVWHPLRKATFPTGRKIDLSIEKLLELLTAARRLRDA